MKVVFLLSRIEQTGVTTHTLDLAEGLLKNGHELYMITGGVVDENDPYLQNLKEKFLRLGTQLLEFKTPKGNLFSKTIITIESILQIVKWLLQLKPQVVHPQSPYMTFLPWLAGKKFTTTVHNVSLVKNIKFKKPTHLIAISTESKQYAIKAFGMKPENISVVCHGVSTRFANPISENEKQELIKKYTLPTRKLLVGCVGRITPGKGLDILMEAVARLEAKTKEKVHLVFLGGYWESGDEEWLKNTTETHKLKHQATIVPFQDPKPFYDIFDIFVMPSRSEAFGLVAVEAMMSQCCTIRSSTNGAYDQIDHGIDGFIFENENSIQLSELLQKVILEDELRQRIAVNGKKKALDNFTIEAMTQKTEVVYQKIRMY